MLGLIPRCSGGLLGRLAEGQASVPLLQLGSLILEGSIAQGSCSAGCTEISASSQQPYDKRSDSCAPSTSYGQPSLLCHHPHAHLQLQQLRAYRIPNPVLQPRVLYSDRVGRAAPQPWPAFEGLKGPPGELRWHRSVVRFPPEVSAEIEEESRTLVISGKAGTIRLSMQALDPTGLLAYRLMRLPPPAAAAQPPSAPPAGKGSAAAASPAAAAAAAAGRSLLALVSPDRARFEAVGAELNKAIRGVMAGYLVGLTVKGVGYRMEPVEGAEKLTPPGSRGLTLGQRRFRTPDGRGPKPYFFEHGGSGGDAKQAVAYPYNKPAGAIRLKVGYSRTAVYPLPPHIRAFFLKPTLCYLYGLELDELRRVAAEVRGVRPPNPYTGNGVQYVDEVVRLKQRKGAK